MSSNPPLLIHDAASLRDTLGAVRRQAKRIGLVPTMGALHEGHMSLVRTCRSECDFTVVSIFVNPSQFGPSEDFGKYPRTLEADLQGLASVGADVVFAPASDEMYGLGYATWIEVGAVAEPLEGQCRPGHFRGVATIVLKLFNLVGADAAYFGQKDYQQTLVVKQMVRDLDVPIAICVCPTVREPDGLAMSSRNRYLSPAARGRALVLWKSLSLARDLIGQGRRDANTVVDRMRELILTAKPDSIDYVAIADPDTLQPVTTIDRPVVALLAVRIDGTRLIDNSLMG